MACCGTATIQQVMSERESESESESEIEIEVEGERRKNSERETDRGRLRGQKEQKLNASYMKSAGPEI